MRDTTLANNFARSMDARAKLICALVLVITVVLDSCFSWTEYASVVALCVVFNVLAASHVGKVLLRSLVVLPFSILMSLFVPTRFVESWTLPGMQAAFYEGLPTMVGIISISWLSVFIVMTLMASTTNADLYSALGRLHVPSIFVMMLQFIGRYFGMFTDQLVTMQRAMVSRAPGLSRRKQAKLYGNLAGNLVVRSSERGERVFAAMEARGYNGTMPVLEVTRIGAAEILLLVICVLTSASIWLY